MSQRWEHNDSSFILRKIQEEDTFDILSAFLELEINGSIHWLDGTENLEFASKWVKKGIDGSKDGSPVLYTLLDGNSGAYIGSINFHRVVDTTFETGYWIAPPSQNKGVCSKALERAIEKLRQSFEASSIIATVSSGSQASIRVLEKNGFIKSKQQEDLYFSKVSTNVYVNQLGENLFGRGDFAEPPEEPLKRKIWEKLREKHDMG